jgi:hypothetical protein
LGIIGCGLVGLEKCLFSILNDTSQNNSHLYTTSTLTPFIPDAQRHLRAPSNAA